jgi:hypothetical protein
VLLGILWWQRFAAVEVDYFLREMFYTGVQSEYVSDEVYSRFGFEDDDREPDSFIELRFGRVYSLVGLRRGKIWYNYSYEENIIDAQGMTVRINAAGDVPFSVDIEKRGGKWYVQDWHEDP